jgi:hypothetical protein
LIHRVCSRIVDFKETRLCSCSHKQFQHSSMWSCSTACVCQRSRYTVENGPCSSSDHLSLLISCILSLAYLLSDKVYFQLVQFLKRTWRLTIRRTCMLGTFSRRLWPILRRGLSERPWDGNADIHGIYVRRMIKYMNSQATNTAMIAPKISHVMPVEVLLYACNRPPVAVIRSAFFDKRPDAFSINYLSETNGEGGG